MTLFRGPIHWTDRGVGQIVIALHGLGGDSDFWASSTLPENYRLVALDLRGAGGTPASPNGHSIADLADDVAAVLDQLGTPGAHVVGFSMGGLVAQAFAVRYPQRIDRLVLASTYARMSVHARMFLDAIADLVRQNCTDRTVFDLVGPWLFSDQFIANPAHAPYLTIPDAEPDTYPGVAWLNQYAAQREFDGSEAAALIAAPTLVLGGGQDHLIPLADIVDLADRIPEAALSVFDDCGHLINFEQPQRFDTEVAEFLGTGW